MVVAAARLQSGHTAARAMNETAALPSEPQQPLSTDAGDYSDDFEDSHTNAPSDSEAVTGAIINTDAKVARTSSSSDTISEAIAAGVSGLESVSTSTGKGCCNCFIPEARVWFHGHTLTFLCARFSVASLLV